MNHPIKWEWNYPTNRIKYENVYYTGGSQKVFRKSLQAGLCVVVVCELCLQWDGGLCMLVELEVAPSFPSLIWRKFYLFTKELSTWAMTLCKEKVMKMMGFRKICSLYIVNRQSPCQSQMLKRHQSIYHSAGLFNPKPFLENSKSPYTSGSLGISEVDQGAVWWWTKTYDSIFAFPFSWAKALVKCKFRIEEYKQWASLNIIILGLPLACFSKLSSCSVISSSMKENQKSLILESWRNNKYVCKVIC